MKPYDNPIIEALARSAIPARPARDGDSPERILTAGTDFHYLGVGEGDTIGTVPADNGLPTQIVVDRSAASATAYLAVDARTDVMLEIHLIGDASSPFLQPEVQSGAA